MRFLSCSSAALGGLLLLATGCVGPRNAIAYASLRSECKAKEIAVVEQDGHDLVLDVCGVHENWKWHGFNGWEYAGPAGDQPPPEPQAEPDDDSDGIVNSQDACPSQAGPTNPDPKKNGCPPPSDADGDGIVDVEDACPQVAGVANEDKSKHGCPPPEDSDGDGISDDVDACPQVVGVASTDASKNGCPPDRDGDAILDDDDQCPDEPGVENTENPKLHGCPKPKDNGKVIVTKTEIVITQRVEFATGSANIKPASFSLIDEIAQVLKDHPEVTKVEVQGHTDDRGSADLNRRLSEARAAAVVKALAKRGVEESRMAPKGYGPDKPLIPNDNDEARQKNRRVQFVILERADQPKTGQPGNAAGPAAAPAPAPTP